MEPGGMPDLGAILQQAQKMQEDFAKTQAELADETVEGSAGGGLVKATISGSGELEAVVIDPKVVDPDDVESLQDLVVAAVRDASTKVGELAAQRMGAVTDGLGGLGGLGLPGM